MSSSGRKIYYHRSYETNQDYSHNSSGGTGRARSGSVGVIDTSTGARTQRLHYHAQKGKTTLVREMPDHDYNHSTSEQADTAYSFKPTLIPGAVTSGTEKGTKRWDDL